jgi:hypothetical protein
MFVLGIMLLVCEPAQSRREGGTGFGMNKGKQQSLFPHRFIIRLGENFYGVDNLTLDALSFEGTRSRRLP